MKDNFAHQLRIVSKLPNIIEMPFIERGKLKQLIKFSNVPELLEMKDDRESVISMFKLYAELAQRLGFTEQELDRIVLEGFMDKFEKASHKETSVSHPTSPFEIKMSYYHSFLLMRSDEDELGLLINVSINPIAYWNKRL